LEQRRDPRPEASPSEHTTSDSGRRARIGALIELLGDDSPVVFARVGASLEALGRAALPALRRAARSPHARRRARARRVVAAIERRRALRRILGYALREEIDLERGFYLLARLERPDFDSRPYKKALDAMGAELRARVAGEPDGLAAPMALPQYLGNELGFVGSETDFNHPDNAHLHRSLERRRGMPLTLVALYLFVARRAGLRAAPLALPGRVLLRLYTGPRSLIIDPFLGGRARTRADCVRYLAQHGLVPRPQWFADTTDAALFQRHLLNLIASLQARGLSREARELQRIAAAANRARSERARAERTGRQDAARKDADSPRS
jgi:regulator of sirC expression with transglutaminase-like and TPR domain